MYVGRLVWNRLNYAPGSGDRQAALARQRERRRHCGGGFDLAIVSRRLWDAVKAEQAGLDERATGKYFVGSRWFSYVLLMSDLPVIARHTGGYRLVQGGRDLLVSVRAPLAARLAALMPLKAALDTSRLLLCPMPGLITALSVAVGQEVKTGDPLATVEAMKMENVLYAERDGVVDQSAGQKGATISPAMM